LGLEGLFLPLNAVPAYRRLVAGLDSGRPMAATAPDAAKPFVLAALWRQQQRPMLLLCPRPEDARRLVDQLTAYLGDDAPVHHFAESEVLPYERMALDAATVHQRLGALSVLGGLSAGPAVMPLVVTSTMALMQKTVSPALFHGLAQRITAGDRLALEPTLAQWARMGYRFVPLVEEPGTMSRRGGIIDIFTPSLPFPVRIDLWGDRVDSIRLFDPASQRSLENVPTLIVLVAQEVLPALVEPSTLETAMKALDYANCKTSERDRLNEELAELSAGMAMEHAGLYTGFFNNATLLDHLPQSTETLLINVEPSEFQEAARQWEGRAEKLRIAKQKRGELPLNFPSSLDDWAAVNAAWRLWPSQLELSRYYQGAAAAVEALPFDAPPGYGGHLERLGGDIRPTSTGRVVIATQHSQRVAELVREADVGVREVRTLDTEPEPTVTSVVHVTVEGGWTLRVQEEGAPILTLLTDTELFGTAKRRAVRTRTAGRRRIDAVELTPGQFVVHIDHGVAQFVGTAEMGSNGVSREYLVLDYAQGDKLYIPMDHLDRVSPYVSGADHVPTLTRLGTAEWGRSVTKAKESTKRLAIDLLQLYAHREMEDGHAFAPDTPWQREMEDAFPFVETPDQADAISRVKEDMEARRPMDRLVCGDVGYGKTEVALRGAFKAVMGGKQVAVLVPTTVLAQQHHATFTERFSGFPVRVEVLSRFRTVREQVAVLEQLKRGEVDIVVGTHRLLQQDVEFKDLGLVIIDEEHRFGVGHKERLREMRQQVDILAMTATPIPRTLHMAMAGIRDISTMETPPEHRLPIKTFLGEASDDLVREAILRELDRGGQVFYLHNRVKSIDLAANEVRALVPEATVMVAHGQMPEEDLARAMNDFADGAADVLLCTTIIESGLDLPAVNTLIVERADRFGLAQLYQLRGRIGRRAHRAYAYLLVPQGRKVTETAQRRLQTVLAATELGAGFRIAMKDLEIRGAGNILGPEQSGYIHAVGFELYARLLADAVNELRASALGADAARAADVPEPQVDLGLASFIPEHLVEHMPTRMALYQRMARTRDVEEVDALAQELRDRFGRLPDEVHHLLYSLRVRALARLARVESLTRRGDQLTMKLLDPIGGARIPLERALGHGVRSGHHQVNMPLGGVASSKEAVPWGQALLEVLQRLEEFQRQVPELLAGES
jgi:transcription-repair coupling factor (superfamily II helicase)